MKSDDRFTFVPKHSSGKHSVCVGNHKSSISLEMEFWLAFKVMARDRKISVGKLALEVVDFDHRRLDQNLSSAIRVFILKDAMARAREATDRGREDKQQVIALRIAIKALIRAGNQSSDMNDGLAPMSAVIAGGRTNA